MEIVGVGTEIVECVRIGRMIQRHGEQFLARVFTSKEMRYAHKRKNATEHFAALWAAKEAVLRAIGVQAAKGLAWTDVEIHVDKGKPTVHLAGALEDHARKKQLAIIHVALAHCRTYATAYALALKATS
jgi:holo-[acyl-carrier protein] synthase